MRRKGRSLKRRIENRSAKAKCIIFCEGSRTEPEYFAAFRTKFRGSLFAVETVDGAGVPKTLLQRALQKKSEIAKSIKKGRSFSENDQIWIAFDHDDHDEIAQTINNAKSNGIGIAYSNPCFELWLILHYQDFDKPDDRHAVQRACEALVPSYERKKGKTADFLEILDHVEIAEERASALVQRRAEEGAELSAPSSTVFRLSRILRNT